MTFELYQIPLLILVCAGAGFVQRVSGFGLGIFAMLFLPYIMPSHTAAAAMVCLISGTTSGYNAIRYRKDAPYKTILPLLCAAFVMIPLAVRFGASVPEKLIKSLLGIVLIVLSVYFLFFDNKVHIKANTRSGLFAGALSGILNALFSTGGPPAVLYMTHAAASNAAYFAGIQTYFACTNVYSSLVRLFHGILTREIFFGAVIGAVGALAGDRIGRKLFDKLDGKRLKKIIYIGMIVSGIFMIV